MAVRTYTQSQLNNNMSGTDANAIYYATHGGTGNAPLVSTTKKSGNYATADKSGNLTYTIGGTPVPDQTPKQPSGGGNTSTEAIDYNGDGYASGGGGGGYYESSGSMNGSNWLQEMINAQVEAAYANYARSLQNAANAYDFQKGNTQGAYDTANKRIDTQWSKTAQALKNNLNSTLGSLKENYDYGEGVQRDDANESLQQAYINYMMNKRNLAQNLAAAGISGGATESSLANMFNNYGNSRNSINNTLAKNLAQLLNTYNNNVSSANRAYNSEYNTAQNNYTNYINELAQNYASAMNQLEANYANYKNTYENNLFNALTGVYSGSSISSLANAFADLASVGGTPMGAVSLSVPSIGALANEGAYVNTLAGLMGNMGAAALDYTPTQNTLGVQNVNTYQGNNMGSITDYAKYLAMLEQMSA